MNDLNKKADPQKYLKYFIQQCKKMEEEKTKDSIVGKKINSIVNKKKRS